jgi:hypothetical protein
MEQARQALKKLNVFAQMPPKSPRIAMFSKARKLQKAVNDARTMGDISKQFGLRAGGGEPDPAGVQRNAAGVRQGGRTRDTAFFFAGHGFACSSTTRI